MQRFRSMTGALLGMLATFAAPTTSSGENYALVVGVNDCPAVKVANQRHLRGAERDAERMSDMLQAVFGFPRTNVKLLTGKNATRNEIRSEFDRLKKQLKKKDQFLFHFSGHGTQCTDEAPIDEQFVDSLDEALCPHDANPNNRATLIVDDDLNAWLTDLKCERITVILDCCHSGTGIKNGVQRWTDRTLPSTRKPVAANPANGGKNRAHEWNDLTRRTKGSRRIVALYACQSGQKAYEGPTFGKNVAMGLFSRYLIEGVSVNKKQDKRANADANGDGLLEICELVNFARKRIDVKYNALFKGKPQKHQTPEFFAGRETWAFIEK